jgi:hypothetical protein
VKTFDAILAVVVGLLGLLMLFFPRFFIQPGPGAAVTMPVEKRVKFLRFTGTANLAVAAYLAWEASGGGW